MANNQNDTVKANTQYITVTVTDAKNIGDLDAIKDFNEKMEEFGLTTNGLDLHSDGEDLVYKGNLTATQMLSIFEFLTDLAREESCDLVVNGTDIQLDD